MVPETDVTLTIGLPSYTPTDYHRQLTELAIASYASADEILVVEDGTGNYYDVDTLVSYKTNHGFTHAANTILRLGQSDYIAVVNNDTHLVSGNLKDLCVPGTVTTPAVPSQTFTTALKGCFFVIPKLLLPTIGLLAEDLRQHWSDQELNDRLLRLNIPMKEISSVVVHHEQNQTLEVTPREFMPDDTSVYHEKYKDLSGT